MQEKLQKIVIALVACCNVYLIGSGDLNEDKITNKVINGKLLNDALGYFKFNVLQPKDYNKTFVKLFLEMLLIRVLNIETILRNFIIVSESSNVI